MRIPPLADSQGSDITGRWPLRSFLELGALPSAVGCARLHTRQLLWEWHLTGLGDDAELLMSELVTNSVRITQADGRNTPVRLWLLADRARLLMLIWDASPLPPVRMNTTADAENGRGLLLVESLSTRWGFFAHHGAGKVTWALIQALLQPMQHPGYGLCPRGHSTYITGEGHQVPSRRQGYTQTQTADPSEALRTALTRQLQEQGAIGSDRVADAFRAVPRHLFAPGEPMDRAYANDTVITKRDDSGAALSSISAPWVQATMLEQAQISPGMRVLEIGSGGYNAALIAELAGEDGEVTTVDIDPEVTGRASRCLAEAGYGRVNVVLGDAEEGVKDHAPYDRIIVTAGAWDIPPAWTEQLTRAGRLVVPLRMRGLTRSVAFRREGGHLVSLGHEMCGFVPMQGAGARAERRIALHGDDVTLRIDGDQEIDADGLRKALLRPREHAWTGVRFGGGEPFDGLFLWLACCSPSVGLLARQHTDTARELADPSSPTGTPTLIEGASFAYHTFRRLDSVAGIYEFGAYAHGPGAARLAAQMADCIRRWDRGHREAVAQIAVYPAGSPQNPVPHGCTIGKRHTRITISWP